MAVRASLSQKLSLLFTLALLASSITCTISISRIKSVLVHRCGTEFREMPKNEKCLKLRLNLFLKNVREDYLIMESHNQGNSMTSILSQADLFLVNYNFFKEIAENPNHKLSLSEKCVDRENNMGRKLRALFEVRDSRDNLMVRSGEEYDHYSQ